jgi:RNA polymerase sigma-70 factor (ECF subfamily)
MDIYDDIELVKLSVDGDTKAYAHLVKRHYMIVYRASYKWCGIREDAEDITHEVFIKLAQKLKTFRQQSSFKTWLYRITINTAKDFHRKHAIKHKHETAFALERSLDNPAPLKNEHLNSIRLYKVLNKLPEKQKSALLLVFAEGLNHREAAQVLKCSETTVSWRIFQARKRLKKSMEHEI